MVVDLNLLHGTCTKWIGPAGVSSYSTRSDAADVLALSLGGCVGDRSAVDAVMDESTCSMDIT